MADRQELCYLTIPEAALLLESKQLSPVELTQAFLDRIEAVDGGLHSYVTLLPESALEEARAAEAAIQAGEYRGPLQGIPIALKDLYDTAGVRTTAQSKVLEHRVPAQDATVVTRLREAGTVLLGKLAMHEFALGGPPTSLFVPARNPWNTDHIPGGSSSGSGAAVAAGLCMGSLGSDTGGSIRGPAASCGIVGLKPTYGRVSRAGVLPLSWSLDHVGPMTWTVEDTAYMLQAIAGHDPDDPTSRSTPVPDYAAALVEDVRGLRIGVLRSYIDHGDEPMDADTLAAFDAALEALAALGADIVEVDIPSAIYGDSANSVIMLSEAFAYHRANLQSQPENYGEIVRARFSTGALVTSSDYVQAQRVRSRIRRETAAVLQQVDLVALPGSRSPAASFQGFEPLGRWKGDGFMSLANETGLPTICVPCGFTSAGLPAGIQLMGRPDDESTVLRASYAYQQRAGWYQKRPG